MCNLQKKKKMSAQIERSDGYAASAFHHVDVHCVWRLFHFDPSNSPPSSLGVFLYGVGCPSNDVLVCNTEMTNSKPPTGKTESLFGGPTASVYVFHTLPDLTLLWFKGTKPNMVMFNMFGSYVNDDKGAWLATHHVGMATCNLNCAGVPQEIISETGVVLGDLVFVFNTQTPYDPVHGIIEKQDSFGPLLQKILESEFHSIQDMTKHFDKCCVLSDQFRTTASKLIKVKMRNQQLTIMEVLAGLSSVEYNRRRAVDTFGWWLKIAKSNMGLKDAPPCWLDLGENVVGEIISEMFTVPLKGMIYSHDSYRADSGLFESEEQWTPLVMFPDLSKACFDCEDGMILCVQYLTVFMKLTLNAHSENSCESQLSYIQKYLADYQICYAVGQLKVDEDAATHEPKYVLHAFPLLMDKNWFKSAQQRATDMKPTILMETTNYLSSMFNASQRDNTQDGLDFDNQDKLLDELSLRVKTTDVSSFSNSSSSGSPSAKPALDEAQDEHWRFILHFKAPVSRIVSESIFGLLHSVFTTQGSMFKQYIAIARPKTAVKPYIVGASITDVLFNKTDKVYFKTLNSIDMKNKQNIVGLQNPPFTLPICVASKTQPTMFSKAPPALKATHRRFIVKDTGNSSSIDTLRSRFNKILSGASSTKTKLKIHEHETYLFQNCKMFIFDIPKEAIF
jgi:hypothetical protein